MSEEKQSDVYEIDTYHRHLRTSVLKFLMMPFAFFTILWLPDKIGYISTYSNFVGPVFFILFGFYTLAPDKERRVRKLKRALSRSARFFLIMFFGFIILNIIAFQVSDSLYVMVSSAVLNKRTLFNFLVLNIWPFSLGQSIWFVQSLLYAHLFFLLAEKTNIHKFYLPILIILSVFALATGEFAGFFGFPHFGYPYIPSGAITRAIPYMLIGMYLRQNAHKLEKIRSYLYLILFPVGLAAAVAEIEILNRIGKLVYAGHTVGFGIMALSLCCFALATSKTKHRLLNHYGSHFSKQMYALCEPVSFVMWLLFYTGGSDYLVLVMAYRCLISLAICYIIVFAWHFIKPAIIKK